MRNLLGNIYESAVNGSSSDILSVISVEFEQLTFAVDGVIRDKILL